MVELKVIFHLPKASNVIGKKFLLKVELSAISGTYQSIAKRLFNSVFLLALIINVAGLGISTIVFLIEKFIDKMV